LLGRSGPAVAGGARGDRDAERTGVVRPSTDHDRRRIGRRFKIENLNSQTTDEREDRRLLVQPSTSQPHVRGVGRELIQGGIDWQPQAARSTLCEIDLRPRVIVEGAANRNEPHDNSRRDAERRLVDELLGLFGGRAKLVMAHLVDSGELTLEDVKEAERAIRESSGKAGTQ